MAKFNNSTARARNGESFISTTGTTSKNHKGGLGFERDAKSELFLSAVSDFVQDSYYESSEARQARTRSLVSEIAISDPEWLGKFVPWLRNEANLRSISLVIAMEGAASMVANGVPGGRSLVSSALTRADEPGEALAYWMSKNGRKIPSAIKRGIADAAVNTYNEFSFGKYDSDSKGFTFSDVIRLTHPKPKSDVQADLFKYAISYRFDSSVIVPDSLGMIKNRKNVLAMNKDSLRKLLKSSEGSGVLKSAGLTWESVAGSVGLDADIWTALIPNMGYMALIRNISNFTKHNVSTSVLKGVADRLADPEQVSKSRQLPFRFLSAYKANEYNSMFGYALELALVESMNNIPELKGKTLILVDRSGSMFNTPGKSTGLNFADSAAIFGIAIALRAESAKLVQYGEAYGGYGGRYKVSHEEVPFKKGDSILKTLGKFRDMGGTDTPLAIKENFDGSYDRVILITDEQYRSYGMSVNIHPGELIPSHIPMYTWNLAGYKYGQTENKPNRYTFGGLNDQAFKLIPLLESGRDSAWPWEV